MNPPNQSEYEIAVAAGLVLAPTTSSAEPLPTLIKVASGLNSTEVLMEMRAEERN
jgi:hypothetical protein